MNGAPDAGVVAAFEAHARTRPNAIAVVCGARQVTYGGLNARANALAHRLRERGVGPESLVGVCLDRGVDLVVALLGVVKSGGAYVPLDPAYPDERRRHIASDTALRWVVTSPEHVGPLAGVHDGTPVLLPGGPDAAPDPTPLGGPDNLMYVIHTSGSSGRPKGVCLTRHNVDRLLSATVEHFDFGPDDTWTLFHSYAFDFSVWELWGALAHGGRLVIVPADVARSPRDFLDLLVRQRVTVLNQTPSAFRALLTEVVRRQRRPPDLRWLIFGGERLDPGELGAWYRIADGPGPAVVNMYGITETTVHVTVHRLRPDPPPSPAVSPIGAGLADLRVQVLDPAGAPATTGELYVGGEGVARGYLGRAALTAERFVPDPYGPPGTRRYRTGDLARVGDGGALEFLGRADNQVKIRGFRIELGEVESAIAELPGVTAAVVTTQHDPFGGLRLLAFVTGELSIVDIRTRLGRILPEYAVPARITYLDTLPVTPNGKVDRKALLDFGTRARPELSTAYRRPGTPTEAAVAQLWTDLLGIEDIGADDDFFELGGDSLLGARAIGDLRDEYGVEVSPRAFYLDPTPAGLARALAADEPDQRSEGAMSGHGA